MPSTAVAFPPKCDEDSLDLDEDNLDIIGEDEGGVGMMIDPNVNELEGSIGAIPILPSGKRLRLEILSTWGDNYYVGLNGIDIFDAEGRLISYVPRGSERLKTIPGVMYSRVSISAISGNPSDINVLAEYDNDPRHVTNLIESANFTRDDMHVWLAPCGEMTYEKESDCLSNQSIGKSSSNGNRITYITDGTGHTHAVIASVSVQFSDIVSISMIRIWNYNKSRTHCLRGVRRARLLLDAAVIFDGFVAALFTYLCEYASVNNIYSVVKFE